MNITQQTIEDKLILALSGKLDFQSHKSFQTAIAQAQATDHCQIILNLRQVPFIDSAGLGLLAMAYQNLKLANRQLILAAPQDYVLRVLELANIRKMMPIVATEHETPKIPASV